MSYQIQTQVKNGFWRDYQEPAGTIWETNNYSDFTDKLSELMQTSGLSSVRGIQPVPYEVIIDTPPDHIVPIGHINVINDGAIFHMDAGLPSPYTVYAADPVLLADVVAFLEGEGLTNVTFTPWSGINATNPTASGIIASYEIPKGLLLMVNAQTKDVMYISGAYSAVVTGASSEQI